MKVQITNKITSKRRAAFVVLIITAMFVAMGSHVTHGQGGGADFTRFVGVGDSLTAGFKDGALFASGQQQGFYVLVAQSMISQVTLPLIAEPGIPAPDPTTGRGLMLQIPGTCEYGNTIPAIGVSSGRLNPTEKATNVAVPDQTIGDALTTQWNINPGNVQGTADTAEDFILGFPYASTPQPPNAPRTQIGTAIGLQPTFVSFWLGSNDALGAALSGAVNDTTLTPIDQFTIDAQSGMDALASTGAKGVVLNIPDVTVLPNLFSLQELGSLTGLSSAKLMRRLGIDANSFVPMSALPTVEAILNGSTPGPLAQNQILSGSEVKTIRKRINKYNKNLKRLASEKGWAFTDIFTRFNDYDQNGVTIPGVHKVTTGYLGGLFGLDGINPSATGHALIATAVIEAINARYGTALRLPDVSAIAAADPQVCMISAKLHDLLVNLRTPLLARRVSQGRGGDSVLVAR